MRPSRPWRRRIEELASINPQRLKRASRQKKIPVNSRYQRNLADGLASFKGDPVAYTAWRNYIGWKDTGREDYKKRYDELLREGTFDPNEHDKRLFIKQAKQEEKAKNYWEAFFNYSKAGDFNNMERILMRIADYLENDGKNKEAIDIYEELQRGDLIRDNYLRRAKMSEDANEFGTAQKLYKLAEKYGEIEQNAIRNEKGLEAKATAIIAIASFALSIYFSTMNITGNAITNIDNLSAIFLGSIFFIVGLFASWKFISGNKKRL